jgi:hypothetical protein
LLLSNNRYTTEVIFNELLLLGVSNWGNVT